MPHDAMHHALSLLARLASELCGAGRMHLSGFAVFGHAPAVVGDGVVFGFSGEFVVAGWVSYKENEEIPKQTPEVLRVFGDIELFVGRLY